MSGLPGPWMEEEGCACPVRDAHDCAQRRSGEDSPLDTEPCLCVCHEAVDQDDYDDCDDEKDCHWCGGDGWVECHDPIQCTNLHSPDGLCCCSSCAGSGLAKDMTIW